MAYIIVWRNSLSEPHVDLNDHGFMETYSSYRQAKESADDILDPKDKWYCEYAIFKEVTS